MPLAKAKLSLAGSGSTDDTIQFDFNPDELSYTVANQPKRQNTNNSTRGLRGNNGHPNAARTGNAHVHDSTAQQTPSGTGTTITLKTVLVAPDSAATGPKPPDVKTRVGKLINWSKFVDPANNSQLTGNKPKEAKLPILVFSWGEGFSGFNCNLSKITAKYIRFKENGDPTAVALDLTLTELPKAADAPNPTSGGTAPIRGHVMASGDTLPSLAYRTYGDARHWRALARANDIDDPMRVRPGTSVKLPTLAELDAGG